MRKAVIFAGIVVLCAAAFFGLRLLAKKSPPPASEGPVLVIYTSHPVVITNYIVREFRQRTGIRTKVVFGGTEELLARMKDNAKKGEADLFWGGSVESLETVRDFFTKIESGEEQAIRHDYKAAHGLWLPFSVLPAVIIYNESLVPEGHRPDSWADLLDPYFTNRLIMADPVKSGSSYTILATMLHTMSGPGGATFSGWDYIERLIVQLGKSGLAPEPNLVYRSVASGDFYAGITFENYVLSLQKTGTNVDYRYPAEGTSAVPDGIALLKTARNAEEAGQFVDFVLGHDVQAILFARWQRRSVRNDIGAEGEYRGRRFFMNYPIAEASSSREPILARWTGLYDRYHP